MINRKARYFHPEMLNGTRIDPPRSLFIDALNVVAPQVVESLLELWDIYIDLEHLRDHTLNWPALTAACEDPELRKHLQPLRDGIKTLGERYKLDEPHWDVDPPWLLNTALYTLYWFDIQGIPRRNVGLYSMWGHPGAELNIVDDAPRFIQEEFDVVFTTRIMKYDPNVFSLEGYERMLYASLTSSGKDYLEQAEKEMVRQKWVERPSVEDDYVYEWLVQHHVLGRSIQEIIADWIESGEWEVRGEAPDDIPAEEYTAMGGLELEEKTMRAAIKQVAKATGLRMPAPKRGRPIKSTWYTSIHKKIKPREVAYTKFYFFTYQLPSYAEVRHGKRMA